MNDPITVEPSILSKTFNAPMRLVYDAWTQKEHLCNWQVPNNDVLCEYAFADIKEGGSALHKMRMPSGGEMWLLTKYHELSPHHTIRFTQYPSNKDGEILPSQIPNWPKEIMATIKLREEDGTTHMEFIWQPINPTKEEAEAWEISRPQHGKGWGGAFELLAAYVANRKD